MPTKRKSFLIHVPIKRTVFLTNYSEFKSNENWDRMKREKNPVQSQTRILLEVNPWEKVREGLVFCFYLIAWDNITFALIGQSNQSRRRPEQTKGVYSAKRKKRRQKINQALHLIGGEDIIFSLIGQSTLHALISWQIKNPHRSVIRRFFWFWDWASSLIAG